MANLEIAEELGYGLDNNTMTKQRILKEEGHSLRFYEPSLSPFKSDFSSFPSKSSVLRNVVS